MATAHSADRPTEQREKLEVVEQIIHSSVLHGSEALCHLLRYLAEHALDSPHQHTKEYQIATEVFGRSANFDPRIDSTVRVQTSRLRAKLAEYYASGGESDPWHIEIPKGSYSLIFSQQVPKLQTAKQPEVVLPVNPPLPGGTRAWPLWFGVIAMAGLLVAVVALLYRVPAQASASAEKPPDKSFTAFWQSVLEHSNAPLVVFSNAEFVGRPETGLRYYQPSQDTRDNVFDHYTGVGEVIAVHELDQLFDSLQRKFVLKRGQLLNWDDAKDRDLILIGSPSENLAVREIPVAKDFEFRTYPRSRHSSDLGIHNLNPRPGEQAWYFGSNTLPLTEDYALVELTNRGSGSQRTLLLAGTTTFGTQAAVEFVCDPKKMADLLKRIGGAQPVDRLSALLRVTVQRGVPVDSEIVAYRGD